MTHPFRVSLRGSHFYPAWVLEDFLSHQSRHALARLTGWLIWLFLIVVGVIAAADLFNFLPLTLFIGLREILPRLIGFLFLLLALYGQIFLWEFFYRHFCYTRFSSRPRYFSQAAGSLLYHSTESELTTAFLKSPLGQMVAVRAGLGRDQVGGFLSKRLPNGRTVFETSEEKTIGLETLASKMLRDDPAWRDWLATQAVTEDDWLAAARLVEEIARQSLEQERWWSRARLGRLPPLAADWSYGGLYQLQRYGRDLADEFASLRIPAPPGLVFRDEVKKIETALAKERESNVLLVGETSSGLFEIVWQLALLVQSGRVLPKFASHRIVILHQAGLMDFSAVPREVELEIIKVFREAARAGNVILVIDNWPEMVRRASAMGLNLAATLDPFLAASRLPLVALAEVQAYHEVLESNIALAARFERVMSAPIATPSLVDWLLSAALDLEKRHRVLFTYPALRTITEGAAEYFSDESIFDQALDLLEEIVVFALDRGRAVIGQSLATEFLAQKTDLPLGPVSAGEKEKLLKLEHLLGARVVGQSAALAAVAQSLRRSRAGLRDRRRPIGTFLFLGPTGVGKTETAKALAEIFFGSEDRLLRLDMSEFQNPEALARLIGYEAAPGLLANLLREHPAGLILLDELEKAHRSVLDLFLQILDEGFFTDGAGRRVSARQLMIIATSNAGASLILGMINRGEDPGAHTKRLIASLLRQGKFRPEFINRFDAVVVFHPLLPEQLMAVATLLLKLLNQRLAEKGITLKVNDELISRTVKGGFDPTFGARPMRRFIQDEVEEPLARLILSGRLSAGATVEWRDNDWQIS